MRIAYECTITPQEGGGFLVAFPSFQEALTEGDSVEEALFNAEEVLTLTLDGRMDDGLEIPAPENEKLSSPTSHWIYPSPRIQSALLVRFTRADKSLAELARSLETSWPAVSRLEDPHHWSSLRQINRVAEVFGNRLVLSFEPAERHDQRPLH